MSVPDYRWSYLNYLKASMSTIIQQEKYLYKILILIITLYSYKQQYHLLVFITSAAVE